MNISKKDLDKIISSAIKKALDNAGDKTPELNGDKTRVKPQKQHTPDDIPKIISKMDRDTLISYFGANMGEGDKPYSMIGITKLHRDYNIVSDNKYYKPTFNYAVKHQILEQLCKGKPKSYTNKVKKNCISYLQEKIANPPKELYGKPPKQKQLDNIKKALESEIKRWG